MLKNKKFYYFEVGLYIFIAVVALLVPIFMHSYSGEVNWKLVFIEWLRLTPFLIIFLINNFLLVPKLLFRSKYGAYIISCLILLISITLLDSSFSSFRKKHRKKALMEELANMGEENKHAYFEEHKKQFHLEKNDGNPPPPHSQIITKEKYPYGKFPPHRRFLSLGILSIGLMVIGFNSGVKIFVRWSKEKEERNEKERHYLTTELAYLKQQVSPHFFMNTLNNIHALIDLDSERAKDAIVKLSRLMRYLLYETETDKVPLGKEIDFMESYIELMQLRYDETKLSIDIQYLDNVQTIYVPSLLFLPLIENAFKHGVSNKSKSFVKIGFKIEDNRLIFNIINSNFPKTSTALNEASGIGLENIRKRLNLIYEDDYALAIHSDEEVFDVSLSIPIL